MRRYFACGFFYTEIFILLMKTNGKNCNSPKYLLCSSELCKHLFRNLSNSVYMGSNCVTPELDFLLVSRDGRYVDSLKSLLPSSETFKQMFRNLSNSVYMGSNCDTPHLGLAYVGAWLYANM